MKKCLVLTLLFLVLVAPSNAEMRDDGLFIPKALLEKLKATSRDLHEVLGRETRLRDKRHADTMAKVDEALERKPRSKAPQLSPVEIAELDHKIKETDKEREGLFIELKKLKIEAGIADIY